MACFISWWVFSGELLSLPVKHHLIWLIFQSKAKSLLIYLPDHADSTWCQDPLRYVGCHISLQNEGQSGS